MLAVKIGKEAGPRRSIGPLYGAFFLFLQTRLWQTLVALLSSSTRTKILAHRTTAMLWGIFGIIIPVAALTAAPAVIERLPTPSNVTPTPQTPRRLPSLIPKSHVQRNKPIQDSLLEPSIQNYEPQKMQAGTVLPQSVASLSLDDLEAIAFANNPTLAQSAAEVSAASGRFVQSTLAPNPIAGYQGEEMGDNGSAGQQGFFINQEFVRRQKRRLARSAGSREVALAQQNAAIQQLKVLNDVRCEHFNVLIGERAQVLAKEVHEVSQRKLDKTQQLYDAQLVPYHDVLQARIQAHAAHIAVGNARNRYFAAWRRLASLLGTPTLAPRRLQGDLKPDHTPLEWEHIVQQVYDSSPQLKRAYASVAWKQTLLSQTKSAMQPNLLSVAGLQQDTESNDLIANLQLGMPLPLFNKNQGNIQEAYAELRKAELDVERTKLAIRSRLASTYEVYLNSWNEVNQYTHHILPDARAALDLVVRGYEQQQFDILTVLDAERTFAKANLAYIKSLQDMGITKIVIEGSLLVGSLRENSQANTPEIDVNFSPAFGPGVIPVETDPGG